MCDGLKVQKRFPLALFALWYSLHRVLNKQNRRFTPALWNVVSRERKEQHVKHSRVEFSEGKKGIKEAFLGEFPCDTKITSDSLRALLVSSLWMAGRRVGVLHYQNKNKQQQY